MMYQEIIDNCKKAYKEHNLRLAYQYWVQMYDTLEKKLNKATTEKERQSLYGEYFKYMEQFVDNEVYDITDYGKKQAYTQMVQDSYEHISLNTLSESKDLTILEEFCDFYEWQPVKTENGFNILDLQLNTLVEEEDYQTFGELINRIVGRAIDYFSDEVDWDEAQDVMGYGMELYLIAKKYKNGTKWEDDWLENFKKDLENFTEIPK